MKEKAKRRWGCLWWGVAVLSLIVFFGGPAVGVVKMRGNQSFARSNGIQIVQCLKQYAVNHDGLYPDAPDARFKSANDVFRVLFKEAIVADERMFTAPFSAFKADNLMGHQQGFSETLLPGENHWMLLKHQHATAHPKTPIVIENSLAATWPPRWDTANGSFLGW